MDIGAAAIEVLKIVATVALSAIITGIWLQRWHYREDFIDGRIDELIGEVERGADLACRYWKLSPQTVAITPSEKLDFLDQEADLIGRQMRIAILRSSVGDFLAKSGGMELLIREGYLFRAFTGGEFGSPERICDANRFRDIRQECALYIGQLRKGRRDRLDASWWTQVFP